MIFNPDRERTGPRPQPQRAPRCPDSPSRNFFEKASKGAADVVFLDLRGRGSPRPPRREGEARARKNPSSRASTISTWRGKTISLRINGLDTHYNVPRWVGGGRPTWLEQAAGKLRPLMEIPKIGTAKNPPTSMPLGQAGDAIFETAKGTKKRIAFRSHPSILPLGMQTVTEIPRVAAPRIAAFRRFADYAASNAAGPRTTNIGRRPIPITSHPPPTRNEQGPRARPMGDMWHYALSRNVGGGAPATGLPVPIDGPFGEISRTERKAYKAAGHRRAAVHSGSKAKWARIHPSQVAGLAP